MYHSVIGRRLVECLNKRAGVKRTVREFFDEEYVPLFFGSERLLQNVNNSPYDQKFTKNKLPYSDALRDECTRAIHGKVSTLKPDASFYLGGPASGCVETTSGQVTSLAIPVTDEDVYASWVGAALGLTVQGGITLLIDSDEVLIETYTGWREYRRYLDQTPRVKPMQINTWNCQRLMSVFADEHLRFSAITDKSGEKLETQKWVRLLFALSYRFRGSDTSRLLAYAYALLQSNTTIGFLQLNLSACNYLADLYERLFTVPEGMPHASFANLYDTAESFYEAGTHSEIGLRALRPKDVFGAQRDVPKVPKATDKEKQISFDTYQTWIIAMLNNEKLLPLAEELAGILYNFQQSSSRLKTDDKQSVEDLLKKRNAREFIDALVPIVSADKANVSLYERVVGDVAMMPHDKVPLFLTLVRFKYAAAKAKL